jgi:hypothetical protein
MRRLHVATLGAAALISGIAASAPTGHAGGATGQVRDGNRKASRARVVRIERSRTGGSGTLRACQVTYEPNYPQSNMGMCWGAGVQEGEEATVVDPYGVHGRIRVTTVTEPNCSGGYYNAWTFQYELVDGNLDPNSTGYATMHGIFDLSLAATARTVEQGQVQVPNGSGYENPLVAVDTDGADGEDLIVSYFSCDESGDVLQGTPYYGGGGTTPYALCLDYWMLDGSVWHRGRRDIVPNCTP